MRTHRVTLAAAILLPSLALADDALQLRLDHAVSASDHVVRARYEKGKLAVASELKGALRGRALIVDKDDVEPRDADLVAKTPRMKGAGVFFLLGRFDGKDADARSFIVREGAEGVAWEGTVSFLGYRPRGDEEKLALVDLAKKDDFEAALASSIAREKALAAAVALVDTKARAAALAEIVKTARVAPEAAVAELGPDPFALRALVEIGRADEPSVLEALREGAKQPWIKAASVRALAPTTDSVKRLDAIALDAKASEDEVVAAVDMLFSDEKADVATLEKLSFDARPRVRRAVASALREKVTDLKTLSRLMKDDDASVRMAAQEAARAAARRLGLPMPE